MSSFFNIDNDILTFIKNNYNTYLDEVEINIQKPNGYYNDIPTAFPANQIILYVYADTIEFEEFTNESKQLKQTITIMIVFNNIQKSGVDITILLKKYAEALYNLINENNTFNSIVDITKINTISFLNQSAMDSSAQNLRMINAEIQIIKEI